MVPVAPTTIDAVNTHHKRTTEKEQFVAIVIHSIGILLPAYCGTNRRDNALDAF